VPFPREVIIMTILPWRFRHRHAERLAAAGVTRCLMLAAAALPLACGPISDSRDAADAVVETETIGDTTVVRTVSGSAWGGDATLVPETSIGELEGPDEYLFGSISAIAVDDDHNVYVLDGQARHVRAFDSAGTYVNTFGGGGEGPGEFQVPIGIAVSNGRVLVRDPANGRVQLFVLETGEAEEWRYAPSPWFLNTPLYQDDQGRIYVDNSDEEQRFIVMGPDGYRQLGDAVDEIVHRRGPRARRNRRLAVLDLSLDENYQGLEQRRRSDVTAWVPVQRGCNHRCTFCIVPYVRGPEKNREPDDVIAEIRRLAGDGITEVTLLGQTVNSYRHGDWSCARLLRAVARVDGIRRVRFTSPHPVDVTEDLVEVMATEPAVCEQFHLPLQSGSNAVLKRMVRRYTKEIFREKAAMLRTGIPDIALSTDVIAAFPGETDDDFEQPISFLSEIRFDEAFTYRYSERPGTPATRFPREWFVPEDVARDRLSRLIGATRFVQAEINQDEVGRVEKILVERRARSDGMVLGRTRRNKAVVVRGGPDDIGRYRTVRLVDTTGATFIGERLLDEEISHAPVAPPE